MPDGYRSSSSQPPITPRENILDRVRRGITSPQEAEEEAVELGITPFATTPDSADFDVNAEAWWSLPMTAAWIIWRTDEAVQTAWRKFRRETRRWRGPLTIQLPLLTDAESESETATPPVQYGYGSMETYTGYELERAKPLSLFDVFNRSLRAESGDKTLVLDCNKARRELWRSLQTGNLIAEGISRRDGNRCPIRDSEWLDLDHFGCDVWPEDSIGMHGNAEPHFHKVRVRRSDAQNLWPRAAELTAQTTATTIPKVRGRRPDVRRAFALAYPSGLPEGTMVQDVNGAILDQLKSCTCVQ